MDQMITNYKQTFHKKLSIFMLEINHISLISMSSLIITMGKWSIKTYISKLMCTTYFIIVWSELLLRVCRSDQTCLFKSKIKF